MLRRSSLIRRRFLGCRRLLIIRQRLQQSTVRVGDRRIISRRLSWGRGRLCCRAWLLVLGQRL